MDGTTDFERKEGTTNLPMEETTNFQRKEGTING